MFPYKKPTIQSQGLQTYLDKTTKEHHDYGYKDFIILIEAKLSITSMAKVFNVSTPTIRHWIELYKEEK